MKWRVIMLLPFAVAALVLLSQMTLPSWCWHVLFTAVYGAASFESWRASRLFARGDRLHWAWLLLGVSYAVGFIGQLVVHGDTGVPEMSPLVGTIWSLFTIALNVAGVSAMIFLSRVWNGTGLEPAWRIHVSILMLLLGLAVDGRAVFDAAVGLGHGDMQSLGLLVSSVSDIASIALIGPVFATALALRGGLLSWPWGLQFASSLFWLFDDATVFLPGRWSARADLAFRVLALMFNFSAARAQRWVRASLDEPAVPQ